MVEYLTERVKRLRAELAGAKFALANEVRGLLWKNTLHGTYEGDYVVVTGMRPGEVFCQVEKVEVTNRWYSGAAAAFVVQEFTKKKSRRKGCTWWRVTAENICGCTVRMATDDEIKAHVKRSLLK